MTSTASVPRIRAKTPIGILKAVVRLIREEPLRYYQRDWVRVVSSRDDGKMPPCGTVCCVAGWVAVGTRPTGTDVDHYVYGLGAAYSDAKAKLGLDDIQANRLFSPYAVHGTPGTKRYVEAGVRHIERFMRDELGYTGPKL